MKDKCVICKKETEHEQHELISDRTNYVQGCGQLCGTCHNGIYNSAASDEYEYYHRHDNDGTHEAAAFCFITAFLCIVIAAIYNFLKFLFKF